MSLSQPFSIHEDFSRSQEITLSSDRTFGLVWTVFLVLYALAPLRHASSLRLWPILLAGVLLLLSTFFSRALHVPNLLWAKLAVALSRITQPIFMAVVFYACFVPMGLLFQMFQHDPLRLKPDRSEKTYWIERAPSASSRTDMRNQY